MPAIHAYTTLDQDSSTAVIVKTKAAVVWTSGAPLTIVKAPHSAGHAAAPIPKIVGWYMDGKINLDDLITHTMPIEDINKAFDLMKRGESIRGAVLF